ncbi:hypothetical protein DFH09DRAFT_1318658 [Mycena vulgaris]|nr:hypothetical protein DFH09DRAFT_1318658 [Mycena vulgaris]
MVDTQMFKVGNLVMLIIPGELTTMSSRCLRAAVRAKLISSGILDNSAYVIIAGHEPSLYTRSHCWSL